MRGTGPQDTVKTKTEQSSFMSSIEKDSRKHAMHPRNTNFRFKSIKDEQVIRLSLDVKH